MVVPNFYRVKQSELHQKSDFRAGVDAMVGAQTEFDLTVNDAVSHNRLSNVKPPPRIDDAFATLSKNRLFTSFLGFFEASVTQDLG